MDTDCNPAEDEFDSHLPLHMSEYLKPTFDINSAYYKLYEANGEKEVTLTAQEADALLDYIQHVTWLTNPPKSKP